MNRRQRRTAEAGAPQGAECGTLRPEISLTTRADLERACAVLASMQDPRLSMFRAAADGRIAVVFISDPATAWPKALLRTFRKPVVVVVDDDWQPERQSSPPSDWRCSQRLRGWARAAIVHGAGGEPEHYREAVRAARPTGRLALVETSSACAPPWVDFLRGAMSVLMILPPAGSHPVPPPRTSMQ